MIEIVDMNRLHIDGVLEVENSTFHIPWTRADFEKEIKENNMAVYKVALDDGKPVGYAGMWHIVNEGHITNVAVHEDYRRQGIGERLIDALFDVANDREMIGLTLEVRISNMAAQKLYTKKGFRPEGFRKNYYQDTKEDAVIMWKYFEFYEDYDSVKE
ncbi:MAG: ribosomal protein S18-alanine N-acetyltransferase [Firmicutes bacterium]|nr:ribosomal protein S18-alanine N-acetyltransferase [Bacillota bacterium]